MSALATLQAAMGELPLRSACDGVVAAAADGAVAIISNRADAAEVPYIRCVIVGRRISTRNSKQIAARKNT